MSQLISSYVFCTILAKFIELRTLSPVIKLSVLKAFHKTTKANTIFFSWQRITVQSWLSLKAGTGNLGMGMGMGMGMGNGESLKAGIFKMGNL